MIVRHAFKRISLVIGLILTCCAATAQAGIVIAGTRVIYPGNEREVTIKLSNQGQGPVLVQAWADDGDLKSQPETAKAPFVITPPMGRVDPGKGQTLRMMYSGDTLPTDKESLFWLNVLEIPAKSKNKTNQNMLQVAFRTRIKIFFRPKNLMGNANSAPKEVVWKKVASGLMANNPTPYYVSFSSISLDKEMAKVVNNGGMLAPFDQQTFAIKQTDLAVGSTIYPNYINDLGGMMALPQQIAP